MKQLVKWLTTIVDGLEIVLNLLILGVVGAQIVTRTFFDYPLKFAEEVAVYALIAMIYGGVCIVEKEDTYLRIDIFLDRMPKAGKTLIYLMSRLSILVLVGTIILGELELFPRIIKLTTHAAGIPYSWLHTWIIIFTGLWGLWALANLLASLKKKKGGPS